MLALAVTIIVIECKSEYGFREASVRRALAILCVGFVLFPIQSAFAANGAASKDELRQLYERYFELKDEQKLGSLVYWRNVQERERDGFFRSIRTDLKYRLAKVEFWELDTTLKMEYTFDGITFKPALPPIGRMVASYKG